MENIVNLLSSYQAVTANKLDALTSPESGLGHLLLSLQLLSPLCKLFPVYHTTFVDFIAKFQFDSLRKFCVTLVMLPTLSTAQKMGVPEAAKIIEEWRLALKYERSRA